MPGVNPPSDGGYQYYHSKIQDLEDELQAEAKRNREKQEERVASMEKNYEVDLRKREEEMNDTINRVKSEMNDTLTRERDFNKGEIEKIRAATYDKWGRYNGLEADEAQTQLKAAHQALEQTRAAATRNQRTTEEVASDRISELNAENSRKLQQTAKAARDSALETYEQTMQANKEQYNTLRGDAQKKFDNLSRTNAEDADFQRRQYNKALNETRREFDHRYSKLEDSDTNKMDSMKRMYEDKLEENTLRNNKTREEEGRVYREQIKDLLEAEKGYVKDRNQASSDAIKEYEDDWRTREKNMMESYERDISKLKQQADQSESYFTHLNNASLKDKDLYFSQLISRQTAEAQQNNKDLERTFSDDRNQLEMRMKNERSMASKTLENQLHDANEQRDIALENQAKAYQETMARQSLNYDEQIKALEKELHTKSTSQDAALISPAAEAAIRNATVREYEKLFEAERKRNEGTTDSIKREYTDRVAETLHEKDTTVSTLQQQKAFDDHALRQEFTSHLADSEYMKNATLRNQEDTHARETEMLNRSFSQTLERQRRQYEELLTNMKNDAASKAQAQRQEAEFASRMAQRKFSTEQSEVIRRYEKKMADQKAEFDEVLNDLRLETSTTVREEGRRNKIAMEDQARSYEQKIAQLEAQHAERERYQNQNFADEIDKLRRANALLINKKKG